MQRKTEQKQEFLITQYQVDEKKCTEPSKSILTRSGFNMNITAVMLQPHTYIYISRVLFER